MLLGGGLRQRICRRGHRQIAGKVANTAAADGDPANAPFDVIVLNGANRDRAGEALSASSGTAAGWSGFFAMSQPARATIVTRSHEDFGNRALFDAARPRASGHGAASGVRFSSHSAAKNPVLNQKCGPFAAREEFRLRWPRGGSADAPAE